ncbi:MAG: hypothetical protein P0Y49_09185 [Candidatus Pedobacter colombiensis]|uniref:Uncharacterized protein n=1 Tax=Candidatus Pedobacter colombiensis TaxID=3121371 RepID=A0AAJ5WC51_9SPHI|nr:hypothetical protein [Pedobacter sp.]WEK21313.1 MAG: hypothetical protein P0Y49_09185 [Pedobacter sp.]
MAFDGSEGGPISINEASEATKRWRDTNPGQIQGEFWGNEILQTLMKQEEAVGLRVHFGLDKEGKMQSFITAVRKDESDILSIVADFSCPCPPRCGNPNPLNS